MDKLNQEITRTRVLSRKQSGRINPFLLMLGSAAVTVGVLAYPASLYVCSQVYDLQMKKLEQRFGANDGRNVTVSYVETEGGFTGRRGEFIITLYDSDNATRATNMLDAIMDLGDNATRTKLVDLKFKTETKFGLLGFTSKIVADETYGSFGEFRKYLTKVPTVIATANYAPWNDQIKYHADVEAFKVNVDPEDKIVQDELVVEPLSLDVQMKRDARFTKISEIMSRIENGEKDLDFSITGPAIKLQAKYLEAQNQNNSSRTITEITLNNFKYNGTMLGGVSLNIDTKIEIDNITLTRFGTTVVDIKGASFKQELQRNGNTYGLENKVAFDNVEVPYKGDKYQVKNFALDSAFVNITPKALLPLIIYLSYGDYMEQFAGTQDEAYVLAKEKALDEAQKEEYQWDLRNLSLEAGNGATASISGNCKAFIFDQDQARKDVINFDFDVNVDRDFVSYVGGQEMSTYLAEMEADKLIEKVENKDAKEPKVQYKAHVSLKNGELLVNGKPFKPVVPESNSNAPSSLQNPNKEAPRDDFSYHRW